MILCVCNALTEDEVRAAARRGAPCAEAAYRSLGCEPQCGTCLCHADYVIAEERRRLLAVDLVAASANWALTPAAEAAIRAAAPPGWQSRFVRATTVSDGDGGARPSGEAMEAIREAEVQDDHSGELGDGALERLGGAASFEDPVPGVLEEQAESMAQQRVVFDEEDGMLATPVHHARG